LNKWNDQRIEAAKFYDEQLAGFEGFSRPSVLAGSTPVFHLYPILARDRDLLQTHLKNRGISTLIHYPRPIPLYPEFQAREDERTQQRFPVSERASTELISLPLFPGIQESQQEKVVEALKIFAT
jgi:dTDP-4-amino-4,6-dideoxygalactose transaminase